MHAHPEMDDDELLERFAANTLPAFPHDEHLHVVFVHAGRHPEEATLAFVRDGILRMAEANGAPGKYHETRTTAWLHLIARQRQGFTGTFAQFLEQNPRFLRRDLLGDYYSDELLNSTVARAGFVWPDRVSLDSNITDR